MSSKTLKLIDETLGNIEGKRDDNEEQNCDDKPWLSWDYEMPKCNDDIKCPQYNILTSKKHLRNILKEVRNKFMKSFIKSLNNNTKNVGILLQGGKQSDFEMYDTDTLHCVFRQEPFFRYLFGINEPDVFGIIDVDKNEYILLIENMPIEAERWNGKIKEFDYYKNEYCIDEVNYNNDNNINKILKDRNIKNIYILKGVNTDSGLVTKTTANFKGINEYNVNDKDLHDVLTEARVIKTKSEIELMAAACKVTSQGHVYVMRHVKPKMTERQLEALFKGYTYYFGGSRHQAYECICGSGVNGSILHYGHSGYPNDKVLNNGDTVVMDVGSEYNGYATDITCSFPVNGVFTEQQKLIHNAVYDAQQTVINSMKPGVLWCDMHLLSEMIIIKHLYKNMKILKYENNNKKLNESGIINYFMDIKICSLFMPHGLGHFLGLNVHDVGGYNNEYKRSKELGLCWLRTTRKLEEGMIITVEPGLYFNKYWIKRNINNNKKYIKCINIDILNKYYKCGGCRLEDDVVITKNGVRNLTLCPRTVDDIEQCMAKK